MTNDEIFKEINPSWKREFKIRLKDGRILVGKVFYDSSCGDFIASETILLDKKFKAEDVSAIEEFNEKELIDKIQEL